ncbi:MAG: endonuclease V [Thermoplasmata archaeon]|nr:endonuclease V [Thermoplasmata archaeon]
MWKETYDLVAQIPSGKVTTYGEVARALGDVVASRFVGLAMSMNDDIVRVPCRRVVQSDGRLGGYTGPGPARKAELLVQEGVPVEDGRVARMDDFLFNRFEGPHPLLALKGRQDALRRHVMLTDPESIDLVAGIDIAYRGDKAFAAAVLFDPSTGEEVRRHHSVAKARFPYIPTYLAFRELPLVTPLVERLPRGTVVMYDGNGTLHPLGFGVASHLGVAFDIPTIGVAKRMLCGSLGRPRGKYVREVSLNGSVAGYAMARGKDGTPVYISPGHRISGGTALTLVKRFHVHRIPEPTRAAHIAAGEAAHATSDK